MRNALYTITVDGVTIHENLQFYQASAEVERLHALCPGCEVKAHKQRHFLRTNDNSRQIGVVTVCAAVVIAAAIWGAIMGVSKLLFN